MPDFRSTAGNRALTRLSMQQEAQQRLTQDAFSLAPDSDAIGKALLDKKLYNADMEPVQNEINGIMGDYMEKFNKDPFHAFTREGRKTAGILKQILNHPALRQLEENALASDAEHKRATENRLGKNVVVRGNDVLAVKDGKRQYISMNDIGKLDHDKGEGLLDVDSDNHMLRGRFGVRDNVPSYDMSKLDDVETKIKNAFDDLGSTDVADTDLGNAVDVKTRDKRNTMQLNTALKTLMSTGLTESDKNTLRSEYVKSTGSGATTGGFKNWLQEKLTGFAAKKIDTLHDVSMTESIASKAAGPAGSGPKVAELSAASRIINGLTGNRRVDHVIGNVGESLQGNILPVQETLNNTMSSGGFKDELGNEYANRTVKNLKVFSDATDLKNLSVLTRSGDGAGKWAKIPGLAEYGVVLDKPGTEPALVYQYSYKDENGEPATVPVTAAKEILERRNRGEKIPDSLQKYLTVMPLETAEKSVMDSSIPEEAKKRQIISLRAQTSSDGYVRYIDNKPWVDFTIAMPNKKGFISKINPESQEVADKVSKLGYQSVESPALRDYHTKYSGLGEVSDQGLFGINDEFYEVKARVPLTSFEQLNNAYGGKTLGNREDIHIDTSRLRNSYEIMSPELFNSATLPNMVKSPARLTVDDID